MTWYLEIYKRGKKRFELKIFPSREQLCDYLYNYWDNNLFYRIYNSEKTEYFTSIDIWDYPWLID